MEKYVLVYTGGGGMAETDEERDAQMSAWMNWFGGLGDAIADAGNPFGPAVTVASDGSARDGGASSHTGYSIVNADSLAAAADMAKGCPVLAGGGNVEVYETFDVM